MNGYRPTHPVRVLVAGVGPHTLRTHIPWLLANRQVVPVAFVEIPAGRLAATSAAAKFDAEVILVDPWQDGAMPVAVRAALDEAVRRLRVDAIIVATEPLAHAAYLRWAIEAGRHVFVDKPIVAFADTSNSVAAARRVESELRSLARLAERHPDRLVAVGTQRRYHPAFELVQEVLVEAASRFGTCVTAMQSTHADGQFRFPHELETIAYHGFGHGYGKLGHSGYHGVSLQADVIEATAAAAGVRFDSFSTYAAAVRPAGFLKQIPRSTYERRFSQASWKAACPDQDAVLASRLRGFGEVDVFATTSLTIDGVPALLAQIGLLHTSMSRRSWLAANADLYKGNGRVKHEHHNFVLGPFMSVQVHSYQSRADHEVNDEREFGRGGNNHIEVHVYRNADWWDSDKPALEEFTAYDIAARAQMPLEKMFTGLAKERMLEEFFDCITGERPMANHRSRIESHLLGGTMLSAMFEAVAGGQPTSRVLRDTARRGGVA
ncbi:MAG TPA: Gfo/Idh/MocA family oxidoreductase [Jatrophihabitans sp.]|nr:Gfo/Idh/MocA family oxidoreductase [Jatrophihabitans sp.]